MLYCGSFFVWKQERHCVLQIDVPEETAWIVNAEPAYGRVVKGRYTWPFKVSWAHIRNLISTEAPQLNYRRQDKSSCHAKMHEALERLSPLLSDPGIYVPSIRGRLLRERATELKCSRRTLEKDLKRYFQSGNDVTALMAHYERSGTREKFNPLKPPGRRRLGGIEPFKMTAEEKHRVIEHLKEHYLKQYGPELTDCYADYIREHYIQCVNEDGTLVPLGYGQRPSLRQYQYLLNLTYTKSEIQQKRKGREFNVNYRGSSGERMWELEAPGQQYQIDGTKPSAELVSRFDRKTPIGTANVVYIKDATTSLIVGFHVGLEEHSWETTAEAIRSIGRDWVDYCSKHDVKSKPSDWPAAGLYSMTILGDRAEMVSIASNCLATNLGRVIQNSPSKRPETKGGIESEFRQLDRAQANDEVPGATLSWNSRGRKFKKPSTPVMTLDALRAYHLRQVIKTNRTAKLYKKLPADFEASGLSASPINVWNFLSRVRGVMGRTFSEERMRYELLREGVAKIKPDGIWFQNIRYTSKTALAEDWFGTARAMHAKGWEVKVRWSASNVGLLFVQDQRTAEFEEAELVDDYKDYDGLSHKELQLHRKAHALTRQREVDENLAETVSAKSDTNEIISSEKVLAKKSASALGAKKSDARRAEKFADKAPHAPETAHQPADTPDASSAQDESFDAGDLIASNGMRNRLRRLREGAHQP